MHYACMILIAKNLMVIQHLNYHPSCSCELNYTRKALGVESLVFFFFGHNPT